MLWVLLFCVGLLLPAAAKSSYPAPTRDFFVNDFAGCLDAEDAAEMQRLGEALYRATGAQAVVVTVDSLDGAPIEDYGYDLANEWGIGEKDADSGVLLLLSTGDREVRIEVGKGLEGRLTDGKTGRILDNYAIPYLRDDDFSTGLAEAYKVVVNEIYAEYGQAPSDYVPIEEEVTSGSEYGLPPLIGMFVPVAFVVILIILSILRGSNGGNGGDHHRGNHYGGFYGGGFYGGGYHGGGFSGGGHSSGGGFSGGGGSFGGGGSSRGF